MARRSVSFLLVEHAVIGYILLDGTKRLSSATVAIEIKVQNTIHPVIECIVLIFILA